MARALDLFLQPTRFFNATDLDQGRTWLWLAWITGAYFAIEQMRQDLSSAILGNPQPGWYTWGQPAVESWLVFWPLVALFGCVGGLIIWWIGGWWFNLRVRFSGDREFSRREGRLVYTYSNAVMSVPVVLYALIATLRFSNYADAVTSADPWFLLVLIFPFWSVATEYKGVRARFQVRKWRARFWFVILPAVAFFIILGALGFALMWLTREGVVA